MNNKLLNKKINEILNDYPFLLETFEENLIDLSNQELTLNEALDNISEFDLEDRALTKEQIIDLILNYVQQMIEILDLKVNVIEKLTILPGQNKSGEAENYEKLVRNNVEILCIVGPT